MASSSDIVDIDTENHDPDLTPKVIANKLNLGSKFEEWLTKQNGDPLLVLDFVGGVCLDLDNRALIRNALVANGAEETDFGNIFKFHDSTQLRNAKRGVKYAVPWAFYNSSPMVEGYQGPNREWIAYTRTPTILSAFVTSFSDKTGVLTQLYLDKKPVPEPIGVIAAAIYLIFLFTFIPLPFYDLINQRAIFTGEDGSTNIECDNSSFLNLLSFLAGLVSICTAVLLGFADDILDLRWRHKLLFPTLSSMPLLLVYLLSKNSTAVLLPHFLQKYLGGASFLDIGPFYYIFMVSLVIFCTNAINIIAGINGVEVGQSLVIRSVDSIQLWHHVLSLCFILPFIGTSTALFIINKYPAKAFVGDTYCYWAGMTIAVSALTGRFSKTLLLFLLPQLGVDEQLNNSQLTTKIQWTSI
uniref:UDP-N-acetylglucosamine--dolichyl-phosphate N-acetylglucosaminephosphotransferase n=1 Tax=Meloidogyne javanica TaxID=6303 RepID=A0A915NAQ4_MELJA